MSKQLMIDLFAAADTRDVSTFLKYLTEDVAFRFGNAPTLNGHAQVATALSAMYQHVHQMRHSIEGIHQCGDVWAVETTARYVDRYRRSFAFPACNLMTVRAGRISDYRIFVDNSAMFQPPTGA